MTISPPFKALALTLGFALVTACAGGGHEPRPAAREAAQSTAPSVTNRALARHSADAAKTESLSAGGARLMSQSQPVACCPAEPGQIADREVYGQISDNPVRRVSEQPISTFSVDVDTGSYANVRRLLNAGRLPPDDAVRVEELLNYFSYNYPIPPRSRVPFNVVTELAPTPWNRDTVLMHVGLKGYEVPTHRRKPANLVFLIDASGSMQSPDKLPLLKHALRLLTAQLDARDTIAIAAYAGRAGLVLEPTGGANSHAILAALDNLYASGSTNGAAGIHLAYELAQQSFDADGVNRVILATDGDFNVGTVSFDALLELIADKRDNGVALTALGFGTGNLNEHLLERLADAGNGNYAYIDNEREAHKVLVEEMTSTLQTIATDVKIQIEFNPDIVTEYRLIGYENRLLQSQDFDDDRIDAGDIGAGHTVTALYELQLHDTAAQAFELTPHARYHRRTPRSSELAFVRLRYKRPGADSSELIERPVTGRMLIAMDDDFAFAAAVAAFGQRLRGAPYLNGYDYDQIAAMAADALGDDRNGYRQEFLSLVGQARALTLSLAATPGHELRYRVAH